jgi:S-adenosyl-L-methionine hydrolase (adenosine-forming)
MAKRILTLTTDFGLSDHFAGAMKGVILSICPQARIVDITHEVPAFAIAEGAFLIAQSYRYFPRKTVHVVVVDPGVGTARRPILAEAAGQYFIAPDNGVLSLVYSREKHKVRVITNQKYFLKPVSHTFHGRDIFSPVAAHLAAGVAPSKLGKPVDDYIRLDFVAPQPEGKQAWTGQILRIDRFGNLITNFRAADVPKLVSGKFSLSLGSYRIAAAARNYAERPPGELFVIVGSSGYLEISVGQGSAAEVTGCKTGATARLKIGHPRSAS